MMKCGGFLLLAMYKCGVMTWWGRLDWLTPVSCSQHDLVNKVLFALDACRAGKVVLSWVLSMKKLMTMSLFRYLRLTLY